MTALRIISLVPSVTETLSAWDRTPIACTRFCERPDLPHVGGTKNPDLKKIIELSPDLVVLDAEENRLEDHDELVDNNIAVHVLHVLSLDDVDPSMSLLADRVGASWTSLARPPVPPPRIRAFIPIWRRPWMALGTPTYGSSLLLNIGIVNIYENEGSYPAVDLDDVKRREPDAVLAPSEPYPFSKRHLVELAKIAPTTLVDGKDLFWWGSRTSQALARLTTALRAL
ncbi:MAG: helical backbone metal receptor [Acidimicrobiales bacterium]|jgi:ABC-type Fe3+-hydroxamate transport system substrate-binding protein